MTEDPRLRRRSCNAVLALCRTVRTMRQHAGVPRLGAAAQDRCVAELAALLAEADLVVQFQDGEVSCAGQTVLAYGGNDVPFGLLAEQGIGELALRRGTKAATIGRMLSLMAAARSPALEDDDLAADLHRANLTGLHLRVPPKAPAIAARRRADWGLLPEPQRDEEIARLVERDLGTNAAALAARLVFADLPADGPSRTQIVTGLDSLLGQMLADGDAASAAALLEQAEHHPAVSPEEAAALHDLALGTFTAPWLTAQLEHADRVSGLVALGLQLGDEGYARLIAAAATGDLQLPDWLISLLPPPG